MKNPADLGSRFRRDPVPVRLGNLASDLQRIETLAHCEAHGDLARQVLDESRKFVAWTRPDAPPEVAALLIELDGILGAWQLGWTSRWADAGARRAMARDAVVWSERILDMSGLFDGRVRSPGDRA